MWSFAEITEPQHNKNETLSFIKLDNLPIIIVKIMMRTVNTTRHSFIGHTKMFAFVWRQIFYLLYMYMDDGEIITYLAMDSTKQKNYILFNSNELIIGTRYQNMWNSRTGVINRFIHLFVVTMATAS